MRGLNASFIIIVIVQHYCVANVRMVHSLYDHPSGPFLALSSPHPYSPLFSFPATPPLRSLGCTVVEMLTGGPFLYEDEPLVATLQTATQPETIRSQPLRCCLQYPIRSQLLRCCLENPDVDDFLSKCLVE